MPNRDTPPLTRGVVLRGIGFALAVALGGAAVWLIVTSTTQKRIEIGVLTGLWGLLLGAYSMFGSRRPVQYAELTDAPRPGAAVELRSAATELERAEAAAERRAFQAGLEQLLRREIQSAVSLEVGELRSEIAALRSELLEKVGGQIRLERIETTRVIGSDLEALQQEVRQLKAFRGTDVPAPAAPSIVNLAVAAGSAEPAITRFVPLGSPATAEPDPAQVVEPVETVVELAEPEEPSPAAEPAQPAAPSAPPPADEPDEPRAPEDPFAGLPRIRPFTEFALDPIEPPAPEPDEASATNGSPHELPGLRHAAPDEPADATSTAHRGSGPSTPRRHRRADESTAGQELLAKLLARES